MKLMNLSRMRHIGHGVGNWAVRQVRSSVMECVYIDHSERIRLKVRDGNKARVVRLDCGSAVASDNQSPTMTISIPFSGTEVNDGCFSFPGFSPPFV